MSDYPPEPEVAGPIRTPDQRLRVFISSTLQELAPERAAVQRAVERLRLIPVMFEIGARPHPPRDLYRAYLAQSHVFIGLYWQRYGWVAPDMEISGLEDEYRHSGDLPRLIYIKSPAPDREPPLTGLLSRVKHDEVSYKYFGSAEELEELVGNDLALLLTERFEQTAQRGITGQPAPLPAPPTLSLPHPWNELIGREREVTELSSLLARPDVRLVTLLGPGGVGKTSLALEIAAGLGEGYADGVVWVPLATIRSPDLVVSAIARALDVRERGGYPLLQSLQEYLHDREMLLLLDNFEQVLSAAPLVAGLLQIAPRLKVLATSRSPLHLRMEFEYPVPPLPVPEAALSASLDALGHNPAVQLFVARGQAARPDFALLAETAPAVTEIVRRLDGLPLAIELAAARLKILSPAAILERLAARFRLLTGGAQDLPARQQTMRNAIDWSYSLLEQSERSLFARLSVFAGGFDLEAAEAVCSPEGELDVFNGIATLVDDSLVLAQPEVGGTPRFAMLETIREYAWDRLEESRAAGEYTARHAAYFAGYVKSVEFGIYSGESDAWLDRLMPDHDNFRAALTWYSRHPEADEAGWWMVTILVWLWYQRGYLNEARHWFEQALAQLDEIREAALRAEILQNAGAVAMWQSDYFTAAPLMDKAIEILLPLESPMLLALALFNRGVLATNQGDTGEARDRLEEALPLFRQVGQGWFEAMTHLHLGNVAMAQGDVDRAAARMQAALRLGREVGAGWVIASGINNLGEIARLLGDYAQAEGHYQESRALFGRVGSFPDVARADHSLGYVALARQEYSAAVELFTHSLEQHQKLGVKRGVLEALTGLALVHAEQEQVATAVQLIAATQARFGELGAAPWPADQLEVERRLPALRQSLGKAGFTAAQAAGEHLSPAQAVELARGS